uniref:TSC22 domain family protein 3 n=1 Tax=Paramormyrops kingsleyae TaxID=1676925 RepID=A0A3B3QIA1_9TELE
AASVFPVKRIPAVERQRATSAACAEHSARRKKKTGDGHVRGRREEACQASGRTLETGAFSKEQHLGQWAQADTESHAHILSHARVCTTQAGIGKTEGEADSALSSVAPVPPEAVCHVRGGVPLPYRPGLLQLRDQLVFQNLNTDKLNNIMRQDSLESVVRDPCYLLNEGICNSNIDQTMLSILLYFHSASGASVVAIDNKIEQAMDLVKNHLMYAVREEVEILKEQIKELAEKNNQLERENSLLKNLASPEQLEKFQSRLPSDESLPTQNPLADRADQPSPHSPGSAV